MKKYRILWYIMTAAYGLWMIDFMQWDTYTMANTLLEKEMYPSKLIYFIWVIISVGIFFIYPEFIQRIYYAKKLTKTLKILNIVSLVLGCAYITVYGFLKNPLEYTASMMGLYYPWLFKLWCVFSGISVFTNIMYMYRRYDYHSTAGVVCASIGCAALFVTVNVPSAGEELVMTLQCLSHWSTALIFAFLCAASIVIFLVHKCREKDKRFIALTVFFVAVLALMLVLLVAVGKNGLIENLPMWAAYAVLFLVNFTSVFQHKKNTV
ncbi:MAG: hypothetical protein IKS12_05810 [Eubacterium sp.]|nr:hypothetical protein [Eubacterium sp.]